MSVEMMTKEKKVLIVEDDKGINQLLAYNFVKEGFDVYSMYDGQKAYEKLEHELFDIVVLDVMLPGMDGFRICKSIKQNLAAFNTFVIVLTAKAESEDKLYGSLMGADCYLTKPFSVSNLMRIVHEFVAMRP